MKRWAKSEPATASERDDSVRSEPAEWEERWAQCIAGEQLIDLAEWADARRRPRLSPYSCAFTARLWSFLESIPFSDVPRLAFDRRVEVLYRSAARVLATALRALPDPAPSSCLLIPFMSPLRARSDQSPMGCFVHVEHVERERFVVVVGLASESSGIETTLHRPGRSPSGGPSGGRSMFDSIV
jgi:hypothetical protein